MCSSDLFDLDGLAERLRSYARVAGWRAEAGTLLVEVLQRGEIRRGDAAAITGLGERTARTLLGELLRDAILGASSEKGQVSLRFPVKSFDLLFPRLFPEA